MQWIFILLCFYSASAYQWQLYEGYQVYEVTPMSQIHVEALKGLVDQSRNQIDFWLEPEKPGAPVRMSVAPQDQIWLLGQLAEQSMAVKTIEENLGMKLMNEWAEIEMLQSEGAAFNYSGWNDFDTIITELAALASECPSGFTCTLEDLGTTLEGRPLRQLSVINGEKPTLWLDSNYHAREWLAVATFMPIMQRLIREYDTNADAKRIMDNFNLYIMPIANPDGYAFSWTDDRYWRKNRMPNEGYETCVGTDLNRNFDINWGEPGSSPDPCETTYRGPSAASELEIQAIQGKAVKVANAAQLIGWMSFHTYGQYLLLPYGNGTYPPGMDDLVRNANATCDAIQNTYNTVWACGNCKDVLYETSGTANDWAKQGAGVKYAYVPELRGDDFVVPTTMIEPSFNEFWNGMVAFADDIITNL